TALAGRAGAWRRMQPRNPEFKALPARQAVTHVSAFDAAVAECPPEHRPASCGSISHKAAASGCSAAGSMTTSSLEIGVSNSKGILAEHRFTMADASTVVMGKNSSGWAQGTGWRLTAVEPEALADE